jgi:hypothetical protein
MRLPHFLKSPLSWSAILLFGVAFNLHVADMGETYVARNLSAWAVIGVSLMALWGPKLRRGVLAWSPLWLGGLLLPPIGAVFVLLVNILGGFDGLHMGHYFLPVILLAFGLLVLGLLNHIEGDKAPDMAVLFMLIGPALMPQYALYLVQENPLFAQSASVVGGVPYWLSKPSAGFGQYNLLGSMIASLLVLGVAAFTLIPMRRGQRLIIAGLLVFYGLDLPFVPSKTALLGVSIGLGLLAIYVFSVARAPAAKRNFVKSVALLLVTYAAAYGLASVLGLDAELADRSLDANQNSFQTRFTMWVLGFWGFIEAPVFGHGLGSYLSVYMAQFAQNSGTADLYFFPLVTVPHNLFIHILSETGLFGLAVIMGPFIWLGIRVFQTHKNRWLIAALVFPILLHTQFEYPYMASGAHYWMFAIALVMGLSFIPETDRQATDDEATLPRHAVLTNKTARRAALTLLSAACGVGIFTMGALMADVHQARMSYSRATQMSLEPYIKDRANAAALRHPILGERVRALSNIYLINLIYKEQRFELLRPLALPYFEAHVLPQYPAPRIWRLALQVYVTLGEFDKARGLIDEIERYMPEKAASYRAGLAQYLAQMPNRPQ